MNRPFTFDRILQAHSHYGQISLIIYLMLMSSGCERKHEELVDSTVTLPVLQQAQLFPTEINTDTIVIGSVRNPDDILTLSPILTAFLSSPVDSGTVVQYSIRKTIGEPPFSTGQLNDNGIKPDLRQRDGIFTGLATLNIKRSDVGSYHFELAAFTAEGLRSTTFFLPLKVYRSNKAPVLSNLSAPDTVKLANQTQLLLLTVKVTDSDGLSDIQRVIFNSYRPDGSSSSGNPFKMYDDGSESILFPPEGKSGDQVKSDGVFSLMISMPATTSTGTYRFEFQAFDRSNEPSNILIQRITVRQ
ncbi:MAG: hypothetical protein V1799_07230 [bacterium]